MSKVIAYVGAGGKTSSILEEAEKLHQMGKRVVVTTTTRMKQPEKEPEGTDQLTECLEKAELLLQVGKVVWYGHRAEKGKFKSPFPHEWEKLCGLADVILTEADGSKRLPVKIPASHEPVIPEYTDKIIVIMGLSGLGRPLKEVCHRLALVLDLLNKKEHDILTEEDYSILLAEGYIKPLRCRFPDCTVEIALNQVKTAALQEAAERIGKRICQMAGSVPVRYTNYSRAVCPAAERIYH